MDSRRSSYQGQLIEAALAGAFPEYRDHLTQGEIDDFVICSLNAETDPRWLDLALQELQPLVQAEMRRLRSLHPEIQRQEVLTAIAPSSSPKASRDSNAPDEMLAHDAPEGKNVRAMESGQAPLPECPTTVLYLCLSKKDREAFIGDFQDEFQQAAERLGRTRASLYYTWEVLKEIGPVVWPRLRKLTLRLAGMLGLTEAVRRWFGT